MTLLTVLGLIAAWLLLGFIAFRLILVFTGGIKGKTRLGTEVYYKPSDGLRYMAFGAFAFVAVVLMLSLVLIGLLVTAVFDFITGLNFNSNYSINRFFGTDKEPS